MCHDPLSLQDLIEELKEEDILDILSSFSCKKDKDIKRFLKNKAICFEKLAKTRTYLLVKRDTLEKCGKIEVVAFFSVAPQVLKLPSNLTEEDIQKLDGYKGSIRGKKLTSLPVILIGQLAKNNVYKNDISGDEILSHAISIATKSHKIVGGRMVMIDVKTDVEKLINFYARNGFRRIYDDPNSGFTQMIYMF